MKPTGVPPPANSLAGGTASARSTPTGGRQEYQWSKTRIRCEGCGQYLFITALADKYGQELVGGGYSLLGVVLQTHIATNHLAFTARDLEAHGVRVPA